MAAPRSELQIICSGEQGDILALRMLGTISEGPADPQKDPLLGALGSGGFARKVLFDLSGVDFMDSSGYSWLLHQNRAFRNAGGALALHSVPPMVMLVLSTVRADLVFRIAPDEAAAIRLLQESKA
jgi:anti-anti-sigma factor